LTIKTESSLSPSTATPSIGERDLVKQNPPNGHIGAAVVVKWKRRLTSRVVTSVFQTGQALSQGVENEATITLNEVVKVAKDSTHIVFGFGWKRGKERGKGHRV
jgi:hypothetical protein